MNPAWFSQQRLAAITARDRGEEIYKGGVADASAIGRNENLSTKAKDQQLADLVRRLADTIGPLLTSVQGITATVKDQCRYACDPLIAFKASRLAGVKPEALVPVIAEAQALPESSLQIQLEDSILMSDWTRAYAIAMRDGELAAQLPVSQEPKEILTIVIGAEASLENFFRHGQGLATAPGAALNSPKGLELAFASQAGRDAAARLDGNTPSSPYPRDLRALAPQRPTA